VNNLTETVEIVPPFSAPSAGLELDRGFLQLDRTAVIHAVHRLNLSPALSGTLIMLAMHVRWDGPALTIPGVCAADIAQMINTTPKAARRLLADLESAGAIEWHRATNNYTGVIVLRVNLERTKKPSRHRKKAETIIGACSSVHVPAGLEAVAEVIPAPSAGLEPVEAIVIASDRLEALADASESDPRLSWQEWNRLPSVAREAIPHCHPDAPPPAERDRLEPEVIEGVDLEPVTVPVTVPESVTPNEGDTYLHIRTKKNPPYPPTESADGPPSGDGTEGRIQIEESTRDLMDSVADEICDRRESDGWKRAGKRARRSVRTQAVSAGLERLAFDWKALGASDHRIVHAIADRFRFHKGEQGNPHAMPFDLGTLDEQRRRNAETCHRCDDGWVYLEAERASRICECQNLHRAEVIR
jgi:hypothetical protein